MIKKLDVLCIISVFAFSMLFIIFNLKNDVISGQNTFLSIYSNGILEKKYALSKQYHQTVRIENELGYNHIKINNTECYMSDSNCGNKECLKMGKISKVNDFIICLPHKIIVKIEGESDIDAVSY